MTDRERVRRTVRRLRSWRPPIPRPGTPGAVTVALAVTYGVLAAAALSFGVAIGFAVYTRVGLYMAVAAWSLVAFVYAYVVIRAIGEVTGAE